MAKEKITDIVMFLAEPIAKENGLDIFDIEYKKEGSDFVLRILLDKLSGSVSIDDCEKVSRALSEQLDKKDPIKEAYLLEVSSPGIDRPLKKEEDFERFAGELIDIGLFKAVNGGKTIQGTLKGLKDNIITVTLENGNDFEINRDDTAYVRLAVVF